MKKFAMIPLALFAFSISVSAAPKRLPFFDSTDLTPYWDDSPRAKSFTPTHIVSFHVIDQDGHEVNEKTFQAKPALVNFFFAKCPGICPVMMQSVRRFQNNLGSKANEVSIYSFSVTPKEDTPEVLRAYAKTQKIDLKNWKLLTGDRDQIFALGKGVFKADGSVGSERKPSSFIHTSNIYLVDTKLRLRGIYDTSNAGAMKLLAKDLELLSLD